MCKKVNFLGRMYSYLSFTNAAVMLKKHHMLISLALNHQGEKVSIESSEWIIAMTYFDNILYISKYTTVDETHNCIDLTM